MTAATRKLCALHVVANALLLWLGYEWLGVAESTRLRLALSAVDALAILALVCWLHGATFAYFRGVPKINEAFRMALRNLAGIVVGGDSGDRDLRPVGVGGDCGGAAGVPAGVLVDAPSTQAGEARGGRAHFSGRLLDRALGGAARQSFAHWLPASPPMAGAELPRFPGVETGAIGWRCLRCFSLVSSCRWFYCGGFLTLRHSRCNSPASFCAWWRLIFYSWRQR